jgi:hypothetical protein
MQINLQKTVCVPIYHRKTLQSSAVSSAKDGFPVSYNSTAEVFPVGNVPRTLVSSLVTVSTKR